MAFSIGDSAKTIDVICYQDESVKCDFETYQEYLRTLDESLLELDASINPTKFVLAKTLSYDASRKLKNEQIGYTNGNVEVRLGHMLDDVRFSLVDIKNPGAGLEFKKDKDGYASKGLIEKLDGYGIVQALYTARQAAVGQQSLSKKKS